MSRYQAKIYNLIEASLIETVLEAGRANIAEELSKLPARMKRGDILKDADGWLYGKISEIIKESRLAVSLAVREYQATAARWVDPAASLPKKPPGGVGVFVIMALLDGLMSCRYELQRAIESGTLITLLRAQEIVAVEASRIKTLILTSHRDMASRMEAAGVSKGIAAARKVLTAEMRRCSKGLKKKIAQTEVERQAA